MGTGDGEMPASGDRGSSLLLRVLRRGSGPAIHVGCWWENWNVSACRWGGSPEELGAAPWVGRGGVGGDRRGHCSGLGALWAPFHP